MTFDTKIAAEQLQLAECFKIFIPKVPTTKYMTSYWKNFLFDTNTYIKTEIQRTDIDMDIDMSVSEISVQFAYKMANLDVDEIENGLLEKATLILYWVFRDDPTVFAVPFRGTAGEVEYTRHVVTINFKNNLNVFRRKVPVWKYSEACRHTMYDPFCTLLEVNFQETGTAESGSTDELIIDTTRTEADGYFDLGYIEFLTGVNTGEQRLVSDYVLSTGYISILDPFPYTPGIGDQYKIIPHCKKTYEGCTTFLNTSNFGGFQDIPDPGQAIL